MLMSGMIGKKAISTSTEELQNKTIDNLKADVYFDGNEIRVEPFLQWKIFTTLDKFFFKFIPSLVPSCTPTTEPSIRIETKIRSIL